MSLLVVLAVVLLAALETHILAASRETRAEAEFPPDGRFIEVEGRRVHAVVMGNGPDLVLIHGSSGSTRDFTFGFAERMAAHYRVIAFDRPGLGHSDPLPRGAEGIHNQARVLRAAAAQLGATRPVVLGQSYGGSVALAWALDAPESVAALVPVSAPSHGWTTPLPWIYRVNSSRLGAFLFVPLITAYVPAAYIRRQIAEVFRPQQMPAGFDDYFSAALTLRRASLRANADQRAILAEEIRVMAPRYGALTLPVELVHGDADTTVPFELHAVPLADEAPGATLTRLPGIGHMPHHVAIEEVAAAVDRAAARAGIGGT